MSRSSRFLHLEHTRGEAASPEGPVRLENGGRFEATTGPGEAPALTPAVPEAHVERFKLHGQTPFALDAPHAEGQHFARCLRCETENGRFSAVCATCGADLGTPEQLADNAERWRQRQEADARTRERMRAPAEVPVPAVEETSSLFEPSLGAGLLRRLPHPLARWVSVVGAVGLALLLVRLGGKPVRVLGVYLGVLLAVGFVPTEVWLRRRRE